MKKTAAFGAAVSSYMDQQFYAVLPQFLRFLNKCFSHHTQVKHNKPAVFTKVACLPVSELRVRSGKQPPLQQNKVGHIDIVFVCR